MERDYVFRRGGSPFRRPSRRRGPPWIVWVLLALALIVGITVLIIRLAGGSEEPAPESSQLASTASASSQDLIPTPAPTPEPTSTAPPQTAPDSAPQDIGGLMVVNGGAYEYYHFSEEATNKYITTVANAGNALSGATLYNIVVPTAMDVRLPDSYLTEHNVDSSDQRKAIDRYIYPSIHAMNPNVKTVPLINALASHYTEHIYFDSDRTWTQLGAYYAYEQFCQVKGIQAVSLDQFEKKSYEGFMGSFASQVGEEALYMDTVDAYYSSANTSLDYTDSDGVTQEGFAVIANGDDYDSSLLYLIFAAGDQPYKVLHNSDLNDGSACVVVQESFGNFFIPFLTSHYQDVYVVDYRSYTGNVPELASQVSASDVIILTNVIMTSTDSAVDTFASLF